MGMRNNGSKRDVALAGQTVRVRQARMADLSSIIALDQDNTGTAKPDYWRKLFRHYSADHDGRAFLVAETWPDRRFLGFIIGEVRAWEFNSPPCGWIFALGVTPGARLQHVATRMFEAIGGFFRDAGVTTVRTMIARDDKLVMSFFRSQCMRAGPFIELEMDLD